MSLKARNTPYLTAFVVLQIGVILWTTNLVGREVLLQSASELTWTETSFWGALAGIAALVMTELLSEQAKARAVFWRWNDPLPGCRAFTQHAKAAANRIDLDKLERKHGPIPDDPHGQNQLWYRIYRQHSDKLPIRQSHARYLLLRDATVISALTMVVAAFALAFVDTALPAWYGPLFAVQYVLLARAAASAGIRFVNNVLAEEASN
jgi:hypothetical protein